MCASAPNLRPSGNREVLSSTRSRTYTDEPGAYMAILCSSFSESKANRQTPAATAATMCLAGLIVLLNSTS